MKHFYFVVRGVTIRALRLRALRKASRFAPGFALWCPFGAPGFARTCVARVLLVGHATRHPSGMARLRSRETAHHPREGARSGFGVPESRRGLKDTDDAACSRRWERGFDPR